MTGIVQANDLGDIKSAIKRGYLPRVKQLIKKQETPDVTDYSGNTPLIMASQFGKPKVVQFLIKQGANINAKNKGQATPLIMAAKQGHTKVIEILLNNGAEIGHQDEYDNKSALAYAAERGYPGIVELLTESGADVDKQYEGGLTPLIMAAGDGHADVVKVLIEQGAKLDIQTRSGLTALMACPKQFSSTVADDRNLLGCVKHLVKAGASLEIEDEDGKTALIHAASAAQFSEDGKMPDYPGIVKYLIEHGADLNHYDDDHYTALARAIEAHNKKIAKVLVEAGAKASIVSLKTPDRNYSIYLALKENYIDLLDQMLDTGVKFKSFDEKLKNRILFKGSREGKREWVKRAIDAGADPNYQRGGENITPLMRAASKGHYKVIDLLLNAGADPNLEKSFGKQTALFMAVQSLSLIHI